LIAAAMPSASAQQASATQKRALTEEVTALANGWALLASGDAAKASAAADAVLGKYPRSVPAATLLIEAEIARGGGSAGLAAYERWLGSKPLENAYLLRRVARAILWSAVATPEVGVEALQQLAADDEAEARAQLARQMVQGNLAELRALAAIGDEGAVRRLADMIQKQKVGSKAFLIGALIESKSPLAIAPLTSVLDDKNRPEDVAAAADGLGKLGGNTAIPRLRQLYADQSFPYPVLAAGALYRMGDMTGLALLQRQLTSEVPQIRKGAAEMMASNPDATWHQVVRGLISETDPVVRLGAAQLLAPFDLDLSRQTLEALLVDSNGAVRQNAALAMVERTATDLRAIRRFLRSTDDLVRVKASGRVLALSR
jgi:hypothetical protein